jgi:hypothetical protein
MKLRVLVTGGRSWEDYDTLARALYALTEGPVSGLHDGGLEMTVVHGAARGADSLAARWCRDIAGTIPETSVTEEPHPADWNKHGKAAGPIRNSEMVALGANVCLAFPTQDSIGTWDCIRKAVAAGIPVRIFPQRKASK